MSNNEYRAQRQCRPKDKLQPKAKLQQQGKATLDLNSSKSIKYNKGDQSEWHR